MWCLMPHGHKCDPTRDTYKLGLLTLGQVGAGLGQGSGWLRAVYGFPVQEVLPKQAHT